MIQAFRAIPADLREWLTWIQGIETQGTFTGTLTGYATPPTGELVWTKLGRRVSLYAPETITGTSNATSLTLTGVPASIMPATAKHGTTIVVDNNQAVNAMFNALGTTITFYMGVPYVASGFTNPGVKGLYAGAMLTWLLDT